MKSNLHPILFFILFFNIHNVRSQDEVSIKQYIPNITFASPQAASISKIGEVPIDLSTGKINYTIPIFEMKEGEFTMPIDLSYNYSGLILEETPGYAGVGWIFNIGGSILHTINGLDDVGHEYHKEAVYNYINKLPPYNDYISSNGLSIINHYLENVSNGIFDSEPDKYTVNAGNLNCSFYLDKDNNPIFLKNENYKVSGYSNSGFTLIDDHGVTYVFNKSLSNSTSSINNSYDYISSFLLTEISFPTSSNKILFIYDDIGDSYSDKSVSQTLIQNSTQYGVTQSFEINKNISFTEIGTKKLKKIITNTYIIELKYNTHPTEPAISVINNISITDKYEKSVKSYDFTYSEWIGRRTNLLNVKYNGAIVNEMEYDMTNPYPIMKDDKDYFKKDLWGYYNKSGIPATISGLITPYNNSTLRPSFSDTKIGALTKITYQTKGYSLIEYEPNSVYIKGIDYNLPYDSDGTTILNVDAVSMAIKDENVVQKTFTITNVPAKIKINYSFTNHTQIAPFQDRPDNQVFLYKNDELIFNKKQNWLWEQRWIPTDLIISKHEELTITKTGTYSVKAFSVLGASAEITVAVLENSENFNQKVGGIRVKQTKDCDFNGECITTVYDYTQAGKNTGILLQLPEFYSGYKIQDNLLCNPSSYVRQDFYNYTSIYPLSNFRGSPVLYKIVEKSILNLNKNNQFESNGKTIFSYYGEPTQNSKQNLENSFIIGLLRTKEVKDKEGKTLSKDNNDYVITTIPNTTRFLYFLNCKMVREKRENWTGGQVSGSGCALQYPRPLLDFQVPHFKYQSKNYILQKQERLDYLDRSPVEQTVLYNHNSDTGYLQIQTSKNSLGENSLIKYFYPQDAEMSNKPFVNDLIAKNIVGIPLDIQSFKDGNKLAEKLTVYENSTATNNLLLPKSVYANKGAATIDINVDKKINYDLYDDKGNILQYTPENGIPISIIWGYNKTQPIAKIENATYDQIASYVDNLQSLSNSDNDNCTTSNCKEQFLRNSLNALRASLPQSMVSSYTYDPLVGVTSITDAKGISAYYEYDSFGRLKFVKDQDLNVINSYCYNYKGQTIDCSSASSVVYYNAEKSGFFTKNNCGTNTIPSEGMLYKIEAGKYTSITSQADADAQALTDLNTNGQNYINSHSSCLTIYKNEFVSGFFTKNNCDIGGIAGQQIFGIGRGEYTSTISQADADAKAQAGLAIRGQAYANEHGYCMYTNNEAWGFFQKNDCEYPYWWGEYVWYYVPAGTYFGSSQEDADRTAQINIDAYGQEYANAHGSCY